MLNELKIKLFKGVMGKKPQGKVFVNPYAKGNGKPTTSPTPVKSEPFFPHLIATIREDYRRFIDNTPEGRRRIERALRAREARKRFEDLAYGRR